MLKSVIVRKNNLLPLDTEITVVARWQKEVKLKDMTYEKALELLKRKSKYKYTFYQKGFCQIKEN